MSSSSKITSVEQLLGQLKIDFPQFIFKADRADYWSPENKTIYYNRKQPYPLLAWSVLHELSHGQLGHAYFYSDFELLKLEMLAWHNAAKLGKKYGILIDQEHIERCLDTYRDWLHRRSTCPTCGLRCLQKNENTYQCSNCDTSWTVTSARFSRPYRRTKKGL